MEEELEIQLKIPTTDFSGLDVLNGIGYLEKRLGVEQPDSDAFIGCRAALKILQVIMAKIDAEEPLVNCPDKFKSPAKVKTKDEELFDRIDTAAIKVTKGGGRITFTAVAEAAGVEVSYLYDNPKIKERIDFLRNQQRH